jgi:hypothetical protein
LARAIIRLPCTNEMVHVNTRLWRINQAKVLHLGGAQLSQTAGIMRDVGGSSNWAK